MESKSISRLRAWKQVKGLSSEDAAVRHLEKLNWQIIERRKKLKAAEIDILARDEAGRLAIVEVKSVRNQASYNEILGKKQLMRLERASQCLQFWLGGQRVPALIYLAAVNQHGGVDLIFLDVACTSMSN